MKSRQVVCLLVWPVPGLGFIQYAAAQATISYALLNGTVTDDAGRTVAKATITVRSLDTNQTFTAVRATPGFTRCPACRQGATNSQ
jgi:hypothetical protein